MSSNLFSLEGKYALITGATRGIGSAMAVALAKAGADVVLVQRNESELATKLAIEALGRKAGVIKADVADVRQVLAIVDAALKLVPRIDILVNCAGIQRRHLITEFPDEDWNEVIQVNLSSCFQLSREVAKHMLTREPDQYGVRGKIINITSLASFNGNVLIPAYAAAKGGLALLTKSFSNEFSSKGINVNAIAPGYIETNMTEDLRTSEEDNDHISGRIPCGRWGNPKDFEGPVVFLASNASNYVHGINMLVDGGYMAR